MASQFDFVDAHRNSPIGKTERTWSELVEMGDRLRQFDYRLQRIADNMTQKFIVIQDFLEKTQKSVEGVEKRMGEELAQLAAEVQTTTNEITDRIQERSDYFDGLAQAMKRDHENLREIVTNKKKLRTSI